MTKTTTSQRQTCKRSWSERACTVGLTPGYVPLLHVHKAKLPDGSRHARAKARDDVQLKTGAIGHPVRASDCVCVVRTWEVNCMPNREMKQGVEVLLTPIHAQLPDRKCAQIRAA